MTRRIRTYGAVAGGEADILQQVEDQAARLGTRLAAVRHVVVVASGKGGVGKSLVTANLAVALAARGHAVGAVDGDIHGPSLARMLGAARERLRVDGEGVHPAGGSAGVRVVSTDLLLEAEDAPVRWREPAMGGFVWQSTLEAGALREFLADVAWGALDYLLVDLPPGTDKIQRLLGLIPRPAALLLVTTPSLAARGVVARSVTFARESEVATIALVSNFEGYACPSCGDVSRPLPGAGGRELARDSGLELWAEVPFDPGLSASTDAGAPGGAAGPAAHAFAALARRLEHACESGTVGPP